MKGPAVKMIEECAELTKALCKADRFGWDNHHPETPGTTNATNVMREMGDVREALHELSLYILQKDEE